MGIELHRVQTPFQELAILWIHLNASPPPPETKSGYATAQKLVDI